MPMTSEQIRTKPFLTERKGGYNKDEVVAFLEEVADEFEALHSRIGDPQAASDPALAGEIEDLRSKLASHEGLQDALEKAYADVEQLRGDLNRAREERDRLSQKLATSADPTAAIGEEVAMVLRAAKEAANDLQARAEKESGDLRSEAEQARAAAEQAAARTRAQAETEAAEILERARHEADELLTREMARYDELLSVQGDVSRRLEDAEQVLRSVRDQLGTPTPAPDTFSPGRRADTTGAPAATTTSDEPAGDTPESSEGGQSEGFGVTAADWFNRSDDEPGDGGDSNDDVQQFAG